MDSASWGSSDQSRPLLCDNNSNYGTASTGEGALQASKKRTIGFWSAVFIIFNRILGTGIFATPALVLSLSGSVGMTLVLWVLGSLFAAAGMQVFIVWGCAFPKNGGEKNYLQYLFPKHTHLVLCLYAATISLIGWAAGNALVCGEYFLQALFEAKPSGLLLQTTSFACVTIAFLLHGTALKWGVRIQNVLGIFQLLVLLIIVATGFVALGHGIPSHKIVEGEPSPWRGKENFRDIWKGTTLSTSSVCLGLYSVIYSFIGFSNANYAMGEMKNPRKTIKIAGPLAVATVAALYIFSNIAYLSGASKEEIVNSGRLVVSVLMRNMWGEEVERLVDMGVASCAFGSVLAISFAQGRINQELAKEGVLPFGAIFASNEPFDTPFAGLGLHWFLSTLIIFFVPPGDSYTLVINLASYPMGVINAIISFGLLYLFFFSSNSHSGNGNDTQHQHLEWNSISPITLVATTFFGAANIFLIIAPFVPPPPGREPYQSLPYWTHAVGGCALFGVGAVWWVVRRKSLRIML